ncbi:hypothetical protein JW766_02855 [Candidatus Dojkabacteria bacterium]|nr:hypothetical protein [Candidatus Dojkabacteria bacterium]
MFCVLLFRASEVNAVCGDCGSCGHQCGSSCSGCALCCACGGNPSCGTGSYPYCCKDCNKGGHTDCCCGGCFPPETKVTMADGSFKNIEDMNEGDEILTYNDDIGKNVAGEVLQVKTFSRNGYYVVNDNLLKVSDSHPIYARKWYGRETWAAINKFQGIVDSGLTELSSLEVGDSILNQEGEWIQITSLEYFAGGLETYTLVSDNGTFYAEGFLVHNKGCSCQTPNGVSLVSPANGTVEIASTSVTLDWTDTSDWKKCCDDCSKHYEVRLKTTGDWYEPGDCTNPTSSTCTVSGLSWCTTYQWQVKADNGCKSSSYTGVWTFKTNCLPEVISVTPSGNWSGTETDTDNASGCSDNNPQTFQIEYRDQDGHDDLYSLGIWIDDQAPHVMQMHSSMHGMASRREGDWRMFGWSCDTSRHDTCGSLLDCDCYLNWDLDVPYYGVVIPESTYSICSPKTITNRSDESPWDFYALCDPQYAPPVNWTISNLQGFPASNTKLVDWKVWFYGDIGTNLDIYAVAIDEHGARSGNWQDIGDWKLDLDLPLADPAPQPNSASQMRVDWAVSEAKSGIRTIDRDCRSDLGSSDIPDCGCATGLCTTCENPADPQTCYRGRNTNWKKADGTDDGVDDVVMPGGTSWTHTNYDTITDISSIEDVQYKLTVSDNACNQNRVVDEQELGKRWIRTDYGDTYASGGYSLQIPDLIAEDKRDNLSRFICSSGVAVNAFSPGGASVYNYRLFSYADENKNKTFYDYLEEIVRENDDHESWNMGSFSTPAQWDGIQSAGTDGVYEWTAGTDLNLSGKNCTAKTLVFVPSGQLIITPNFGVTDVSVAGSDNGCVFVVRDNIVIQAGGVGTGSYSSPYYPDTVPYDSVYGFFITDGNVIIDADTNYDQLLIKGGVISRGGTFGRDLLLLDNLIFAAERIEYDARYLDILKPYIGSNYTYKVREYKYSEPTY